ncbi:hypothetical protein ACROYT_G012345 [Oculina patagonica]
MSVELKPGYPCIVIEHERGKQSSKEKTLVECTGDIWNTCPSEKSFHKARTRERQSPQKLCDLCRQHF